MSSRETAGMTSGGGGPRLKRSVFAMVLLFLVLASVEAFSFALIWSGPLRLRYQTRRTPEILASQVEAMERMLSPRPDSVATLDSELGWRVRPNLRTEMDVTNSRGMRGEREYSPAPPAGIVRLAIFGDSFVYGSEVRGESAWPALIEQAHPDIEALNFGVPAYGPGQAYLRFKAEASSVAPHIVALAIDPWMIDRAVAVVATGYQGGKEFRTKPRFFLDEAGQLVLLPNPVRDRSALERLRSEPGRIRELGERDFWYEPVIFENALYDYSATVRLVSVFCSKLVKRFVDPDRPMTGLPGAQVFNASSEAFRVLTTILLHFANEAELAGMRPTVLMLPDGYSVERVRNGKERIMGPLVDFLEENDIEYIDLLGAFQSASPGEDPNGWFAKSRHYSPSGNRVVAERIAEAVLSFRGLQESSQLVSPAAEASLR